MGAEERIGNIGRATISLCEMSCVDGVRYQDSVLMVSEVIRSGYCQRYSDKRFRICRGISIDGVDVRASSTALF